MFQITEMTEAHVASVTNRTETHGDEKVPAVSIGLELTCANTILDECIGNWDDYTEVAIHDGEPTHWMPLPAPPVSA